MLQISQAQFDLLEAQQISRLKGKIIVHLQEHFLEDIQILGPDELSSFVHSAIDEARALGFERTKEVYIFTNIKAVLGIYTPYSGESHDWILNTLTDKKVSAASVRLENLCKKVDAYLEEKAS